MIINGYTVNDYLELQETLLFYFGKSHYESDIEVQNDFARFKESEFYEIAMMQLDVPEDVELQPGHWKVCRTCGRAFLTMDRRSVSITCYREPYRRYSLTSRKYFNADFECRMAYKRNVANKRNRNRTSELCLEEILKACVPPDKRKAR